MFRFLYRVLLLGMLVWGSFVLEYQGKPVRWWVQDWAAQAWDRAWPMGRELALDWWARKDSESSAPQAPKAKPDPVQPHSRVEALAEAREQIEPSRNRENLDFDRPQSAKERRELDERLRRGLR